MDPKNYKPETLSLHGGQLPDPVTGSRAVPIYQTTSYVFEDSDQAASLYNLEQGGHIYSRITNPTVAVLEERIALLEGGSGAVCVAGLPPSHFSQVSIGGLWQSGLFRNRHYWEGKHKVRPIHNIGSSATFGFG